MSVKKKPLVVVTRKLPDSIETRMRELFDARLNLDDTLMTPEQLAEAVRTASAICSDVIGVSSRLSRASNSSRIRVSIESGSLRVTTTRGFFLTDISCSHEAELNKSLPFRPH